MTRRQLGLLLVGASAGVLAVLYQSRFSTEAQIASQLDDLVEAVRVTGARSHGERDRHWQNVLAEHVASDVTVHAADLPSVKSGYHTLLTWGRLAGRYDSVDVEVLQREISLDETGEAATASLRVAFEVQAAAERLLEQRTIALRLQKHDDGFRIVMVEVAARPRDLPEARP